MENEILNAGEMLHVFFNDAQGILLNWRGTLNYIQATRDIYVYMYMIHTAHAIMPCTVYHEEPI